MVAMVKTPQMPREIAELCERMAGDIMSKIAPYGVDADDRIDAIAAGMMAAVKGWPKFEPERGWKPQTFLFPKIKNAMIDFLRRHSSYERGLDRSEGALSVTATAKDKDQEQAAWLADIYHKAKRHYLQVKGINRGRSYPMPQAIALATLMQEYGLGCRACARLLAERDDLRAVLKLKGIPHYSSLSRAAALLDRFSGLQPATEDTPD